MLVVKTGLLFFQKLTFDVPDEVNPRLHVPLTYQCAFERCVPLDKGLAVDRLCQSLRVKDFVALNR